MLIKWPIKMVIKWWWWKKKLTLFPLKMTENVKLIDEKVDDGNENPVNVELKNGWNDDDENEDIWWIKYDFQWDEYFDDFMDDFKDDILIIL